MYKDSSLSRVVFLEFSLVHWIVSVFIIVQSDYFSLGYNTRWKPLYVSALLFMVHFIGLKAWKEIATFRH